MADSGEPTIEPEVTNDTHETVELIAGATNGELTDVPTDSDVPSSDSQFGNIEYQIG